MKDRHEFITIIGRLLANNKINEVDVYDLTRTISGGDFLYIAIVTYAKKLKRKSED